MYYIVKALFLPNALLTVLCMYAASLATLGTVLTTGGASVE